jgi:Spy/CpxP family protein refolding chaperone
MKKRMVMIAILVPLAMPLMAQETNQVSPPQAEGQAPQTAAKENRKRQQPTEEQRWQKKQRELKLMEKALNEIGVTEEQRQQIITLQQTHMEKMKANWKRLNEARRKLSELEDSGASIEELDIAIEEISDAQSEQLKILVRNRKEMERILDKDKNKQLMKIAHDFFESHGRRSGGGMPERPSVPPVPTGDEVPPKPEESTTPPPPVDIVSNNVPVAAS